MAASAANGKIKVTLLGTGTSQGIPIIGCKCAVCSSLDYRDKRLRTSIHIEVAGQSFVVDAGPDFRQQALRERINRLDAVLVTHEHKDHIAGMDDLRGFNYLQKKDMPVYATARAWGRIKEEFAYAFQPSPYPGVPKYEEHVIDLTPFTVNGVAIIPIEVMHNLMPVLGFRIQDFTYITDAKTIKPAELDKIRGTKVLIINALQYKEHFSHLTVDEALGLIAEIGPEQAYLTHISHLMGQHQAVEKKLPAGVNLAFDGLSFWV